VRDLLIADHEGFAVTGLDRGGQGIDLVMAHFADGVAIPESCSDMSVFLELPEHLVVELLIAG
jgi:hypothetical protein